MDQGSGGASAEVCTTDHCSGHRRPLTRRAGRHDTIANGANVALAEARRVTDVLLRFTESVRLNVFGRVYDYGRGEVHRVPLAMVGLLLAEGCVETPNTAVVEQVA